MSFVICLKKAKVHYNSQPTSLCRMRSSLVGHIINSELFLKSLPFYEDESIIIRNAVAFVFLLEALSFSRASLGVVFCLSQLWSFEVAWSVVLSQPER